MIDTIVSVKSVLFKSLRKFTMSGTRSPYSPISRKRAAVARSGSI